MPKAQVIDGKEIAARIRKTIAEDVANFKLKAGFAPGLAVVLVGQDPASDIYVRNKVKQAHEVGIHSVERRLPAEVGEAELLCLVQELNDNPSIHGILVQLPLPKHIDAQKVLNQVRPEKDVDGFHPINAGRLTQGIRCLVPCTPSGVMHLIKSVLPDISGRFAVVLGRSNIVGKPVAQLLISANATVAIAHSKTANLPALLQQADIVVAAIGKPGFVKGDWIKAGAVVIDVGINRVEGRRNIVGDVAYDEASQTAGYITPVPGGVGPMTIACLLENTVSAAHTAFL